MSMQAIITASQSMTRMQTVQSVRSRVQGQANVLRSESKQDGGNAKKEAQADALEEKSNELMNNLMNEATAATETLKPAEEIKPEAGSGTEAEESEKQPNTDSVTISDFAAGQLGEVSSAKIAVGTPVVYKPDGSTAASTPAKSDSAFKATA